MSEKSFYNLDYIIEINERRLEQYTAAYQKVLERLTHIILIYSGITIFLIPLVEDGALFRIRNPLFVGFLLVFLGLLVVSVVYTMRLIIPGKVVYLDFPRRYYEDIRFDYESSIQDRNVVNDMVKASYIWELQEALEINERKLKVKESFHYKAIQFALFSVVPYIICLVFHLSQAQDNRYSMLQSEKMSNFMEIISVSKKKDDKKAIQEPPKDRGGIPGVDNSLIIPSHPVYRDVLSGRSWTYDANGNKVDRK